MNGESRHVLKQLVELPPSERMEVVCFAIAQYMAGINSPVSMFGIEVALADGERAKCSVLSGMMEMAGPIESYAEAIAATYTKVSRAEGKGIDALRRR